MTHEIVPQEPIDPLEMSHEDRVAAAELLDEAYRSGEPEQIKRAHEFIAELSAIGSVAVGEKVTRLETRQPRNTRTQSFGGLRRVSVTTGRMDASHGTPKGWKSPHSR